MKRLVIVNSNFAFLIFLQLLFSCSGNEISDNIYYSIHEQNMPMAIVESDTVNIGEVYKAKVYLDKQTIDIDNKDKIEFKYLVNENSTNKLLREGINIPISADTGYLEFKATDESLFTANRENFWKASLTYPVKGKDTTFLLKVKFIVGNYK